MVRNYTNKQMGDACEMLVAAELTLAGIRALKVPDTSALTRARPIGHAEQTA